MIWLAIISWRYPSLRVAYIEEKEEIGAQNLPKLYSSILVKAVNNFEEVVYTVHLMPVNLCFSKLYNMNFNLIPEFIILWYSDDEKDKS